MLPRFNHLGILDDVESPEKYAPGGFHPISIGGCFEDGRYKVLHKLGYGGSSTIWLARDQGGSDPGRLVALKSLRASVSNNSQKSELTIHRILQAAHGPNGTHLFLVYPFAGPSIVMMSAGRNRLRADLVRNVAKQLVEAVEGIHRVGVVHGDISPENMLFSSGKT